MTPEEEKNKLANDEKKRVKEEKRVVREENERVVREEKVRVAAEEKVNTIDREERVNINKQAKREKWINSSYITTKIEEWTRYCEKFGDKTNSVGYKHGQSHIKKLRQIQEFSGDFSATPIGRVVAASDAIKAVEDTILVAQKADATAVDAINKAKKVAEDANSCESAITHKTIAAAEKAAKDATNAASMANRASAAAARAAIVATTAAASVDDESKTLARRIIKRGVPLVA